MTRQEKELAKQRKEMQKIWDANGAAIYEANREYKAKHGKEMDVASRNKAIKDATMNGVFHAGAYASNLEAEKTRQDAQNERMANKMTRFEKEEEVRWQEQQKAAEEKRKAEELQAGYAAYYAAMRQGEQEVMDGEAKIGALLALDDLPWWKKLIAKGKELVNSAKEKWHEQKKKSYFFYNAKGQNLVEPAGEDEILRAPDIAAMKTYIATAINVQRTGTNNPWQDDSGNGPAQISRQQLNTPYGEGYECEKGECRGYGLALPGEDPFDPDIAVQGMINRIRQVIEEAERLAKKRSVTLDETDIFIRLYRK